MTMTGKEMVRESRLLNDLIAERDCLREQVKALTKPWISMSNDEILEAGRKANLPDATLVYFAAGCLFAEMKLKERNT